MLGGNENEISGNRVTDTERYGIALFPAFDLGGEVWMPDGNRVTDNDVAGSGLADLALSTLSGAGNCFADNLVGRADPTDLESQPCDGEALEGSAAVDGELAISPPEAAARFDGFADAPDHRSFAAPEADPGLADPGLNLDDQPDRGGGGGGLPVGLVVALVASVGLVAVVAGARRRRAA